MNIKEKVTLALLAISAMVLPESLLAQSDNTSPYFESAAVRDKYMDSYKPIWTADWSDLGAQADYKEFKNDPKYGNMRFRRLKNRKALVGRDCSINNITQTASVAGAATDLGALTDENIENYALFASLVDAKVAVGPVVMIRDMANYYAKGTEAGFCIVASSGDAVLSLDAVKALSIGFYRDGHLVGTKAVKEGQDAGVLGLKLIQIPGSDEACIMLTATSDWLFDQVSLDRSGAATVGVGDFLKVKYAFVGEANTTTMTYGAIKKLGDETGRNLKLEGKGWNPVLLGIPFPWASAEVERFLNDNLDDYGVCTPVAAVGYQGGAKFSVTDKSNKNADAFPAGCEVGFRYSMGGVLDLSAGMWINLVLYDRNGNKVQEETVSAEVLGLSLAKGGDGTVSVTSKVPFSGCEIKFLTAFALGVVKSINIHNAFVNEKPDVNHRCQINPTAHSNVCPEQTTYRLTSNPDVPVTWSVADTYFDGDEIQPTSNTNVRVTADGVVTGLEYGQFTFIATAADGCKESVVLTVGLNFGKQGEFDCADPLANGMSNGKYELSSSSYDPEIGLLTWGTKPENPEKILDTDFDNYAEYTSGITATNSLSIIGIRKTDGLIYDATDRHDDETPEEAVARAKSKRLGFIIEHEVTGLDLSILDLYTISCFHKGKKVYAKPITENNAVSAGIAGSDRAQKIRFSIEVPMTQNDGTPMQIDEFQLWIKGVADLTFSKLRIYYAFIEDADSDCNDPLGCSAMMISNETTGATINGEISAYGQGIDLATTTDNLTFLIDDDPESYFTVAKTVAANGVSIGVNLGRTFDYRHQFGVIMDQKTFLANVGVGSWLTLETYYNGKATGEKFTDWNVVSADVAGYGEVNFMIVQPHMRYDAVRLTIAGVVSALDIQNYYGLFVRGDADGDGIPDCQDQVPCGVMAPEMGIDKVCVGSTIGFSGDGSPNATYILKFSEPGIDNITVKADGAGKFVASYQTKAAGKYQMIVCDEKGNPIYTEDYTVHPTYTEWRSNATNTDWNKWDNWTNGSPYCCTNVVISADSPILPVLGESKEGDEFCCASIHFEKNTSIGNITSLNYDKAWVDLALTPNSYHLLSAPLKDMYTGDFFVPANMAGVHRGNYFDPVNKTTSPENRFNPSVYQRLWARKGTAKLQDGSSNDLPVVAETHWSHSFNYLARNYGMGEGFSAWVDNGTLPESTEFLFRFPKLHTEYNYYSDYDYTIIGKPETLSRTNPSRFIYETTNDGNIAFKKGSYDRVVYNGTNSYSVTLKAESETDMFLLGNPFMSPIDIATFLTDNKDLVKGIRLSDSKESTAIALDEDGDVVGLGTAKTIAPMRAVFIETLSPAKEVTVNLSRQMTGASISNAVPTTASSMKLNFKAPTMVTKSIVVTEEEGIEMETLFDSEVKSDVSIFMIGENRALDMAAAKDVIPLAVVSENPIDIKLDVESYGDFPRDEYILIDRVNNQTYELDRTIELKSAQTSSTRFALVRSNRNMSSISDIRLTDKSFATLKVEHGKAYINTLDETIEGVEIYKLDGSSFMNIHHLNVDDISVDIPAGVSILKVTFNDGSSQVFKVLSSL